MASLNKVFLIGNLTRDPELRYTNSGASVCEFGMAINRTYTVNDEKKDEVCYVDINVWGKQAESCNTYLQKGSPVFIEGRLQLDQWTDKESGKQRSRLRIIGERVQFLSTPGRKEDFNQAPQYNNTQPANSISNTPAQFPGAPGGMPAQQQPSAPAAASQQPVQMQNNNIPGNQIPGQAPMMNNSPAGVPQNRGGVPPQNGGMNSTNPFSTNIGAEDDIPF